MRIEFRLRDSGEPDGQIDLARLEKFASNLRAAALKSAQGSLGLPAYTRSLSDGERRPEFRLVGLSDGSTTLTVEPRSDREIEEIAIVRHVDALASFRRSGAWPADSQSAERQAWGSAYQALLSGASGAFLEVTLDQRLPVTVDRPLIQELEREDPMPQLQEAEIVGSLHLIEMEERPRFKIRTPNADLTFDLTRELRAVVDELRWKTVRATAHWEIGTTHARLVDGPHESHDPAGVELRAIVGAPGWLAEQLRRLTSFAEARKGWDGADAHAPAANRITSSSQLLRDVFRLYATHLTEQGPVFGLFDDGSVEYEWQVGTRFMNGEAVRGGWELLCQEDGALVFNGIVSYGRVLEWIGWLVAGHTALEEEDG